MNQEEVGDSERRREMKCFFCLSSLVTTGKGVGEGKCSQDQSGSLPDNYFQVRTVGGLVWGSARTFIWTCPKLSMPIGMKQGCGKCLRDYLSLSQNRGCGDQCCLCSAQSAVSVPAFLFLLPEISALEGLRHPWNAPPYSDTQQVWRFWRPVLPWWPCLGRKSKTSHPKAVSDPGAPRTSLVSGFLSL